MHTLFLLAALLLAAAVGGLGALLLRLSPAGGRRSMALVVLGSPPFVLAAAASHLVPRLWPECTPLAGWDQLASLMILAAVGLTAAGALVVNVGRLLLTERLFAGCPLLTDSGIRALVAARAERIGAPAPAVRFLCMEAPLAVTGGLRRPTVVLSSWLLERLDAGEMEAVLTHELAHLARRDHVTRWIGRFLRDATVYLPGGWYALRVLERDEELAADALAVEATRRPLAMASALGKVWSAALGGPRPVRLVGVPGYGASAALLEERLTRLLEDRAQRVPLLPGRLLAAGGALSIGVVTPRLLIVGASALPLACGLRPW